MEGILGEGSWARLRAGQLVRRDTTVQQIHSMLQRRCVVQFYAPPPPDLERRQSAPWSVSLQRRSQKGSQIKHSFLVATHPDLPMTHISSVSWWNSWLLDLLHPLSRTLEISLTYLPACHEGMELIGESILRFICTTFLKDILESFILQLCLRFSGMAGLHASMLISKVAELGPTHAVYNAKHVHYVNLARVELISPHHTFEQIFQEKVGQSFTKAARSAQSLGKLVVRPAIALILDVLLNWFRYPRVSRMEDRYCTIYLPFHYLWLSDVSCSSLFWAVSSCLHYFFSVQRCPLEILYLWRSVNLSVHVRECRAHDLNLESSLERSKNRPFDDEGI